MNGFHRAAAAAASATLAWFSPDAGAQISTSVFLQEFVDGSSHYRLTLSQGEANALGATAGWRSTGYFMFEAASAASGPAATNPAPVCRFETATSRFFTADPAECDFLRTHDTGWSYKGIAFNAIMPTNGACPAGTAPVYRLYNDRAAARDSNHRFNWDDRVRARMIAQGWIDEGVAFCGNFPQREPSIFDVLLFPAYGPAFSCHGDLPQRCVAVTALREMNEQAWSLRPPDFRTPDAAYTPDFNAKTGWTPPNVAIYSASFADAPAQHSFAEWFPFGQLVGIHLAGSDRRYGSYATMSPTIWRGSTGSPIVPWADRGDRDVIVNFQLKIATVVRSDDSAQAYGGPVFEFVDQRSGRHVLVRALAYGSQAPSDFTGTDPVTGYTMVSTSWASPRFGRVLKGEFILCGVAFLATGGCPASGIDYSFRIDPDDFAKVLGLAQGTDPALSGDIADYVLLGVQIRNETFGDAELGLLENFIQFVVTR